MTTNHPTIPPEKGVPVSDHAAANPAVSPKATSPTDTDRADRASDRTEANPVSGSQDGAAEKDDHARPAGKSRRTKPECESGPMVARLEALHRRVKADLRSRIEAERDLGIAWNEAKKTVIPRRGIGRWVKANLTFSQQYANRCGKLASKYHLFPAADDWYQQTGIAAGFRTKKGTGVDYALEVIDLYERLQRREHESSQKVLDTIGPKREKKPTAKERVDTLERERDTERSEKELALAELARVVRLYRATPQGKGFDSPVLTSMKGAASLPLPSGDDPQAGGAHDLPDDTSTPGGFERWQAAREEHRGM